MMAITKLLNVTYNNFKLLEVIDPDQFDANFSEIVTKLDTVIDLINHYAQTTDGDSGADNVGLTTIVGIAGNTIQAFLEALITQFKSSVDGSSGADFINATAIAGVTGTTIQAMLESLKSLLDTHASSEDHDSRYYTKTNTYSKTETDTLLQNVELGLINDNSLTTAKMATEQKRGVANGVASLDASQKVVEEPASKGQANGICPLDSNMRVPVANLSNAQTIINDLADIISLGGVY